MATVTELFHAAIQAYQAGDFAQACARYGQVIQADPAHADAHNNLGLILAEHGQMTEAGKLFQQALAIDSRHTNALNNLGNVLKEENRFAEAIACFRKTLALNPNQADAYANLGNALIFMGQRNEAAECYRHALTIDPSHQRARWSRCILRLQQGDLAAAWPDFDLRWTVPGVSARTLAKPRWDGAPFPDKTLLVYAEQGLGDTIQFQRFLSMVTERGGTVLFECPSALLRLFKGLPGADQWIPVGQALPEYDLQIPLMSLPGIFGTTLATIPTQAPLIQADPRRIKHWRNEIKRARPSHSSVVNVGIAWQSEPKHPGFHLKSFPLACFEPLARVDNVQLASLQVGPGTQEIAHAPFPVLDLGSRFNLHSLDDLAAALANMHLVVTVDTAVAHLAGAMGIPTWVALPYVACWRWLLDRSDSPWYPTIRLFRQKAPGDWNDVFKVVAAELADRPLRQI